jgi:cyclophilin family peptidyl-prolyl cis-trans isomerase
MQARPDDVRFALSWAKFKQGSVEGDPAAILEIYRTVHERFPTNASVCETYARQLMDQARYPEAIDALRGAQLDPAEAPKAVYMLADATFAEQRFEEVGSILETIPESALARDARLRGDVERLRPLAVEHIDLWAAEQELRAAEAETGDLPMAEIHTSKGRVVIELFENEAPNTVANFISLAESGFYDGTKFHRFVPDFMVQGGDPNSKDDAPEDAGAPGSGNPGYFIPDEHDRDDHRNHFRDSLAMAKQPAPNTAGCQFYLNHRPTPWLNGRHTVFGRVVDGLDVRLELREDDEITAIVILRKRDHEYAPETVELPAPLVPPTTPGG